MLLLAQINFKDLPENSVFPKKGILQIYISDSDLHGCGYYDLGDICKNLTLQKNFKIFYFENEDVDQQTEFNFLDNLERGYNPLGFNNEQYALYFKKNEEYVPTTDINFENFLGMEPYDFFDQFGKHTDELRKSYSYQINSRGHKMGGYGFVLQEDPREQCSEYKDYVLLLQIDSDNKIGWGDSGSAQFFIKKKDLEDKNFSNVIYYWAGF